MLPIEIPEVEAQLLHSYTVIQYQVLVLIVDHGIQLHGTAFKM
jgi:hypothetical protein